MDLSPLKKPDQVLEMIASPSELLGSPLMPTRRSRQKFVTRNITKEKEQKIVITRRNSFQKIKASSSRKIFGDFSPGIKGKIISLLTDGD